MVTLIVNCISRVRLSYCGPKVAERTCTIISCIFTPTSCWKEDLSCLARTEKSLYSTNGMSKISVVIKPTDNVWIKVQIICIHIWSIYSRPKISINCYIIMSRISPSTSCWKEYGLCQIWSYKELWKILARTEKSSYWTNGKFNLAWFHVCCDRTYGCGSILFEDYQNYENIKPKS